MGMDMIALRYIGKCYTDLTAIFDHKISIAQGNDGDLMINRNTAVGGDPPGLTATAGVNDGVAVDS